MRPFLKYYSFAKRNCFLMPYSFAQPTVKNECPSAHHFSKNATVLSITLILPSWYWKSNREWYFFFLIQDLLLWEQNLSLELSSSFAFWHDTRPYLEPRELTTQINSKDWNIEKCDINFQCGKIPWPGMWMCVFRG